MRNILNYIYSLLKHPSWENFKAAMQDVSQYLKKLWEDCFDLDMYLLVTFMVVFVLALVLTVAGN